MIRFAISLRLKLGIEKYEYLTKTFYLPSGRTINYFSSPSTYAPNGILFDSLKTEKAGFDYLFPDYSEKGWYRHGVLVWDSMLVKDGVILTPVPCM